MYLITNRNIKENTGGLEAVFDEVPNRKGPNELRVAEIGKSGGKWRAEVLEDELGKAELAELVKIYDLPSGPDAHYYRDLEVAHRVVTRANKEKRNILIFVHGYNNDVKDVVERVDKLEKHYGVIVVPFSWPANGGGFKGLADYKDDKNDAKASVVALDRLVGLIGRNLHIVTQKNLKRFRAQAQAKHPNDAEKAHTLYTRLVEKDCPFTLNLMLHSMGNYLFKQMFKSSISLGSGLVFDNVIMVAADANNLDHATWLERVRFKRRLYVTINENDQALAASRIKSGQDQLARLGHVLYGLNAARAHYVNFTDSAWVGNSHAYFEGNPRAKNDHVHNFFKAAVNGERADKWLRYKADINCYELKNS